MGTVAQAKAGSQADWTRLEKLFGEYLQGDSQAARPLFSEFLRVLRGYFRHRMGASPDAEDLVQASLLKIHFARDRFDPSQRLKTWVFTIASRTLIDHWRGARSETEGLDASYGGEDSEQVESSVLDTLASELLDPARKAELHGDLNQALMKLKPMERSIVYLYGVEGLSMAEIGQVHAITESAAKLRAHRAYQELRKHLSLWATLMFWMERLWK